MPASCCLERRGRRVGSRRQQTHTGGLGLGIPHLILCSAQVEVQDIVGFTPLQLAHGSALAPALAAAAANPAATAAYLLQACGPGTAGGCGGSGPCRASEAGDAAAMSTDGGGGGGGGSVSMLTGAGCAAAQAVAPQSGHGSDASSAGGGTGGSASGHSIATSPGAPAAQLSLGLTPAGGPAPASGAGGLRQRSKAPCRMSFDSHLLHGSHRSCTSWAELAANPVGCHGNPRSRKIGSKFNGAFVAALLMQPSLLSHDPTCVWPLQVPRRRSSPTAPPPPPVCRLWGWASLLCRYPPMPRQPLRQLHSNSGRRHRSGSRSSLHRSSSSMAMHRIRMPGLPRSRPRPVGRAARTRGSGRWRRRQGAAEVAAAVTAPWRRTSSKPAPGALAQIRRRTRHSPCNYARQLVAHATRVKSCNFRAADHWTGLCPHAAAVWYNMCRMYPAAPLGHASASAVS